MISNRTVSLSLWGLGLLGTLVCMALSAAGLRDATYTVFVITLFFLLFGFLFAKLDRNEEHAADQKRRQRIEQALPLKEAYEAMDAYEAAVAVGESGDGLQKKLTVRNLAAIEAILAYGDITVNDKQIAMVATAKAAQAAKHLQELSEQVPAPRELDALQRQTAELCCEALRAIRTMTLPH